MKRLMIIILLVLFSFQHSSANADAFDHSVFDTLMQNYVKNGLVNYKALATNRALLRQYLRQLEQLELDDFKKWSRDEKIAFWINAYNAITIEGILRHYPIKWGGLIARARFPQNSIRQIGGFWDTVFIQVMGRDLTLNQIEHEILRAKFDDPRIHFVIVCASIGCPILESNAFYADNLDQRLENASHNFVNDPDAVQLDKKKNVLYLSSIFKWYKKDFAVSSAFVLKLKKYRKSEKGVVEFVLQHLSEADKKYVLENQPKIKYLDYDWSLNEQK